jgi:hypothetical protein
LIISILQGEALQKVTVRILLTFLEKTLMLRAGELVLAYDTIVQFRASEIQQEHGCDKTAVFFRP